MIDHEVSYTMIFRFFRGARSNMINDDHIMSHHTTIQAFWGFQPNHHGMAMSQFQHVSAHPPHETHRLCVGHHIIQRPVLFAILPCHLATTEIAEKQPTKIRSCHIVKYTYI